jgi:hypothetical protein
LTTPRPCNAPAVRDAGGTIGRGHIGDQLWRQAARGDGGGNHRNTPTCATWPWRKGAFSLRGDWRRGASEAVIGAKVRDEIFGSNTALGQLVRIGDRRMRVVGVLAASGQGLGMNTDELVFVPVSLAQAMFNSNTLFRILVEAHGRESIDAAKTAGGRDHQAAP